MYNLCYTAYMINLQAAGLTETEAKTYTALLSQAEWQPRKLALFVEETRTNMYKILDRLVELGLAERYDKAKKLHYRATNPSRLLELAHELKATREHAEKELELSVQSLTHEFIKANDQPGIRFFQGKDEIRTIFEELAHSSEPVSFVHTLAGIDFYGYDHMHELRMLAVKAGVKRSALTPDTGLATADYKETDALFHLTRTWLQDEDYTAPVEWGVFENKLYIISYGQEALGVMLESEQVAEGFKQLFKLIERGQRAQDWYSQLPRLAKRKAKRT